MFRINAYLRALGLATFPAVAGLLRAAQWQVTFDDGAEEGPPLIAKAGPGRPVRCLSEASAPGSTDAIRLRRGFADPASGRRMGDGMVLVLDDHEPEKAVSAGVKTAPEDAPAAGLFRVAWDMLIVDEKRGGNLFVTFPDTAGAPLASLMINLEQGVLNLLSVTDGGEVNARLPARIPAGQPVRMAVEFDLDAARCRVVLGDIEVGSGGVRSGALQGIRFMTTVSAVGRIGLDNLTCGPVIPAVAAAGVALAAKGPGFDLARGGEARAVIVVPSSAAGVTELAATELQRCVERACGVRLEIVPESQAPAAGTGRVYVGPCRRSIEASLDPLGFAPGDGHIRIDGNEMFLIGKDGSGALPAGGVPATATAPLGTLYTVYDWLDRQLGVRWLWPGAAGEYVPRLQTVASGAAGDRRIRPSLLAGRLRFGGMEAGTQKQTNLMEARAFEAFLADTRIWMRRQRLGEYINLNYGHAYEGYWKRFGKEHPEYFAQRLDGQRGPTSAREDLVQMCVSAEGLHRQIIADWLKQRVSRPDKPWINGAENDRRAEDPACTCAACRAWDVAEAGPEEANPFLIQSGVGAGPAAAASQSHSDRYARFWMALQRAGEKHDPAATVIGYAYSHYSRPPVKTRLNDRVVVEIVPPYYFPRNDAGKGFESLWGGWAWTGAKLFLRPNYFLGGYCLPYIFAREFGREFKYALSNNLVATDFDSLTSMWGVQGPNLYMLGRLHARPDLGVEQVLDEYYGAFGAGASAVQSYFDFWEALTTREYSVKREPYGGWLFKYADSVYTVEMIEKAEGFLAHARTRTVAEPDASARVAFLAKGLAHTRLLVQAIREWKAFRENPFDRAVAERFRAAIGVVMDFRRGIIADFVVNPFYARNQERMDFDLRLLNLLLESRGRQALDAPWSLRWDPEAKGVESGWFARDAGQAPEWRTVKVGSTWQGQAAALNPSDDGGIGWYRTGFERPDTGGRTLRLVFGAVDRSATVWLNGIQIHERKFWAALDPDMWQQPFAIDLPEDHLAEGKNVLVVRVEGRPDGGIWKPVQLIW